MGVVLGPAFTVFLQKCHDIGMQICVCSLGCSAWRPGPDLQDKIKTGELLAKSERWELLTAFHEQYCSATESL